MSSQEPEIRQWFKEHLAKRIDRVLQEEACPRADLTDEGWALLFVIAESGLVRADPRDVEYADRGQGDGKVDIFYQTEDLDTGSVHFHILQVTSPAVDKIRNGASRGEMIAGKLENDVLLLYKNLTGARRVRDLNGSAAAVYEKLTSEIQLARDEPTNRRLLFHIYPVCLKRINQDVQLKLAELKDQAEIWSKDHASIRWIVHDIHTADRLKEDISRNQSDKCPAKLDIVVEQGIAGEAHKQDRTFLCFARVRELLDCYTTYGAGLFDGNLRYYLGRKTAVNSGIFQELQTPTGIKRFYKKNNGITFVCDHAKPQKKDGKGATISGFELVRPQIINGGQTLVTIHEVYHQLTTNRANLSPEEKRCLAALEEMVLPTKVIPENDPRQVDGIAIASNTQNPLTARTLRSSTGLMRDGKVRIAHHSVPWYLETKDGEWAAVKEKGEVFMSLTGGRRFQEFQIAGTKRYRRLDNSHVGIALLSFYGYVQHAKKSRVFEKDYFEEVFNKHVRDDSWATLAAAPPTWGDLAERSAIFSVGMPGVSQQLLAYHIYRYWESLTYPEERQRTIAWRDQGDDFERRYHTPADGWNVPTEIQRHVLEDKGCAYHRERYARAAYLVLVYESMRLLHRRYGRLTDSTCERLLSLSQLKELNEGLEPTEFRAAELRKDLTPLSVLGRILLWAVERMWISRAPELSALGSPQQALLNREWVQSLSRHVDEAVADLKTTRNRLAAGLMIQGVEGDAPIAELLPDLP